MALVPCQVLRVAILLSYCSILCNYKAIEMPSHQTYGGSWKFLTFIDLVIQAVFFGICVLTDLSSLLTRGSGNQEQERQLKKLISLRDWMLAVLAFPVGVFVVAVFWIIYAYDREMIYPKLLDNFIPGWLNHGMHTTVLPFILIEMRTSHHAYPSRSSGLAAICTFSVGYILWWGVQFSHYPQFSKILCSQLSALPQNHSSVGFKTPHFSLSSTSVAPPFSVSFLTSSTSNYPLNLDPFQGSLMDLRSSDCVRYLGNLNLFPWPQPPSFRQ
uniref:Androgen-induced gene 1 protein isoform X1 n=1 Tax=Camelus bactrianus TaxID=9837 RepID=A0A9W3HQJ3_CAMBA|nr:androgen-induced gene 1 protein isoform X1 [Camelus bactrianus]